MLNGAPLNSVPLNSAGGGQAVPDPEYIVRGTSFVWRLRLMVGGLDMTAQLTGSVEVDREEGAAGIAGFGLFIEPGIPVLPLEWVGRAVSLDLISTGAGVTTEARRFTGWITDPVWNPLTRILSCDCSDRLQHRVEALEIDGVDALVGGAWSADLFEPVDGRSRWDYALERMESRTASLDCSPTGELRVTSWYAGAPAFEFGPGTTLFGELGLDLQPLNSMTNRVEIKFDYRYSRLWQLNETFGWSHSNGDFCSWRTWSTELPDTALIAGEIGGSGLTQIGRVGGTRLPLSAPDPCGTGNPWINTYDDLWLAASVSGARRWTQTVTETINIILTTPEGEAEGTQNVQRDNATVDIESDRADNWESSLADDPSGVSGSEDTGDNGRRSAALDYLLRRGKAKIVSGHRGTTISWAEPTPMVLPVDLIHTLVLADQGVKATGKCRRLEDRFDLASGAAVTTISIAVMRGAGASDPLVVPAPMDLSLPNLSGSHPGLPTQLGGRLVDPVTGFAVPPYDDDRLGFSGNYDAKDDFTAEDYPRRFKLQAREIPEEYRDERTGEADVTYQVGVPADQLEM
jgi:hypothetical protein